VRRMKQAFFGMVAIAGVQMMACQTSAPPTTKIDNAVTTVVKKAAEEGPPTTRREEIREEIFGEMVADPYRWLEDEKSGEVQAWMATQDHHARGVLATLPGRTHLSQRFSELYYVDSVSAPKRRGNRFFYSRRHADKEKRVHYWREGTGPEEILLDPNTLSEDGSISVGRVVPSWDGLKLAYTLKANNADEAVLYVMDVATGAVSDVDVIEGLKYSTPSWTPEGDGFYYTFLPTDPAISTADRPGYAEIRFHRLGDDPSTDRVVREKTGDPKIFVGCDLSRDGRYLFYYHFHGWASTDIYYRDLQDEKGDWQTLVAGTPSQYYVLPWQGHFYIATDEGAPRWRIFKASAQQAERKDWVEIIAEDSNGAVIDSAEIIGGHLVLTILQNAQSDLLIYGLDGMLVRDIELPGIGATYGMTGNPEDDEAYFSFQSFTLPPRIYETSISTGSTTTWAEIAVPIDPEPFVVEQVWYPSKDGTKVSMFIVRSKDAPLDGTTPLLLYGYGGFDVSMRPSFRASIYPWLEAGGSYAVPNLRGGGEYGKEWHEAGMLGNKQNVFDDFIAAAEYLIREGYTQSDRLAIRGGSNGGLLVGAAMTQRPDLYRAVICAVPLLDMVRYHLFGSGKTWITEYGSADDKSQFGFLHAYSPYHRVEGGTAYPALLMLSADSDDRVDPMHARKMTAQIQAATTSPHPALLRIEKNAGHGGGDLVKKYVETDTDVYSFLMNELGVEVPVSVE
jgi:prolyl oligopeptidase